MRRLAGVMWVVALAGCSRPGPVAEADRPPALKSLYGQVQAAPSAAGWLAVARAEALRRDWLAAVDAYEKVLQSDPRQRDALGELASLRLTHGERAAAEKLIATLETNWPNDAQAQAMLGDLYGRLGRRELSRASLAKALRLDPRQNLALLRLAQEALQREDLPAARGYGTRLLAAAPDWYEARTLQLQIAYAGRQPAEIEGLLRRLWEQQPNPGLRASLTAFYLTHQQAAKALAVNEAWLKTHPNDIPAQIARCEALAGLGRGHEAVRVFKQLVEAKTPDARVYLAYGRLLMAAKRFDEAAALLREAVRRAPIDSTLQLAVADLYAAYDKRPDAAALYQQLMVDDPRFRPRVGKRLGMLAQAAGTKPDAAGADYIEANYLLSLSSNPDDVTSLNNLAYFYADQNRNLKVARQMIDRALAQRRDSPLLDTRGWVRFREGDLDGAATDLAAALAIKPDDPLSHYHLACVREAKGDPAGALASARAALSLGATWVGRDDCDELVRRLEGTR